MKRIADFLKTKYHLLFLLAFTVFFAWTMRYSALFGDDYYYASFIPSGARYFFSENISHYLLTNGRAWVHILDEILLASDGMWAVKLFKTAVAAAAVTVTAFIASDGDGRTFRTALAASCVLFSLIGIQNAYQSVFWATGSLNYFFPIVLSLLYFAALRKESKAAPFIALFASSSSEQAAFFALCTTVFFGFKYIKDKKRPGASYIVSAALSVVGFVLLFAAPGNAVRTGYYPDFYAMPLFERIASNIPLLGGLVFSKAGLGEVLLFWFAASFLSSLYRKKREAIPTAAVSLIGAVSYYGWIHLGFPALFLHISAAATFAVSAIDFLLSLRDGKHARAFLLLMAAALQFAMLLSPEFGARTVLCSTLLLMIPTAETVCEVLKKNTVLSLAVFCALIFAVTLPGVIVSALCIAAAAAAVLLPTVRGKAKNAARYAVYALAIVITVLSADRMYTFVCGYRENYTVHRRNAESIAEYKERGGEELVIYYLKDPDFKYIMP